MNFESQPIRTQEAIDIKCEEIFRHQQLKNASGTSRNNCFQLTILQRPSKKDNPAMKFFDKQNST